MSGPSTTKKKSRSFHDPDFFILLFHTGNDTVRRSDWRHYKICMYPPEAMEAEFHQGNPDDRCGYPEWTASDIPEEEAVEKFHRR